MSGGVAYVLDESGDFEHRCNLAMVELEPIPAEDQALESLDHQGGDMETHGLVDIMHDMTCNDVRRLRNLIERHRRYTGSERARHILENWSSFAPRFVKVMPVDYRQALEKMRQSQMQSGLHH